MASPVAQVLQTFAPEIDEQEFAAELRARFEAVSGVESPPLTGAEQEFLERHGSDAAQAAIRDWDPSAERRRRNRIVEDGLQHVLVETLSVGQVTELTGKSRSQITRDLNGGRLYGFSLGRRWRVPRWQFPGGILLPGLDEVVPAIPGHLHPAVVQGFMSSPQDDLDSRTPVEHLRTGGDPEPVADLVADLAR